MNEGLRFALMLPLLVGVVVLFVGVAVGASRDNLARWEDRDAGRVPTEESLHQGLVRRRRRRVRLAVGVVLCVALFVVWPYPT